MKKGEVMETFFEKYGKIAIVVAIGCFILLFLMPLHYTVNNHSSGFVDEFGKKVVPPNYNREDVPLKSGREINSVISDDIKVLYFTDKKAPKEATTIDLSNQGDGKIKGWKTDEKFYISTEDTYSTILFPKDASYMFDGKQNLTQIYFDNVNTNDVQTMRNMFNDVKA